MSTSGIREGAVNLLRPFVRAMRSAWTKLLHPLRMRKTERLLGRCGKRGSILFLCTGNICRSPYAEKAFLKLLGPSPTDGLTVRSAGFLEPGRPSPEPAVRVAATRDVSLDGHVSRKVDARTLEDAKLIVVMEIRHRRRLQGLAPQRGAPVVLLGDLDPEASRSRDIRDPWGHPDEVFEASFERIDRCVARLGQLILAAPR